MKQFRLSLKFSGLFSFLLILVTFAVVAFRFEDDPFTVLLQKLKNYHQKYPQEKIHLHLDKPYYAVGDDIWFKAYLINTLNSGPSTISNAVYVELINDRDSVVQQLKLPVTSGFSWGDFKLNDSFLEGNYRIRAYTQWMRNLGPEFFFDKTIKIGNSWTSHVFVSTHYQFSKQNHTEQTNAVLKFTDNNGSPLSLKPLTYQIELAAKNTEKGTTTTNEMGEARISFSSADTKPNKTGRIITAISLTDHNKVIREIPVKAISDHVDVQFFPESGSLVEGMPNKLGIKAVNVSGLGEDISGSIIDDNGTEVTKFSTTHLGMGSIVINPKPGKTYRAKVTYKDGSEDILSLPKSNKEGYVLSVEQDQENVIAKVLVSESLLDKGGIKLIAMHNNNVYFVSKANQLQRSISAIIPKKDLPTGIIQFTLFSPQNLPVCERLVFINNENTRIDMEILSLKKSYSIKDSVALQLKATLNKIPARGSFSVSVTNSAAILPDEMNESNIFTSLLLTSDLTGYVEKPNYYFLDKSEKTQRDLDNLLLTQGWRRILWKNIINNSNPNTVYEPEKSLKISGVITTHAGKAIPNSVVSLIASAHGMIATDSLVTDGNGRFSFDEMNFSDSTKIILQARSPKNKQNLEIKLDAVSGQIVTNNKNTGDIEVNVNEAIAGYLKKSENYFGDLVKQGLLKRSNLLDEVTIVEKKNPAKYSANLNGAGNADALLTSDQLQACFSIAQCLERTPMGITLKNGIPYLMRSGAAMQVYLDGIKIDSTIFRQLIPANIQTVEVLKNLSKTAVYGMDASTSGVLVITTKRPGDDRYVSKLTPGMITINPKGFAVVREFYSPRYNASAPANSSDQRSTIYWNPNIITSEDGTAKVSYFNSAQPGIYRVVIEGMDMNGNLSHSTFSYEVK